jgi:hypothetical protein
MTTKEKVVSNKDTMEDLVHYYILLTISGQGVPTWLLGSLILNHFISPSYIDTFIEF